MTAASSTSVAAARRRPKHLSFDMPDLPKVRLDSVSVAHGDPGGERPQGQIVVQRRPRDVVSALQQRMLVENVVREHGNVGPTEKRAEPHVELIGRRIEWNVRVVTERRRVVEVCAPARLVTAVGVIDPNIEVVPCNALEVVLN